MLKAKKDFSAYVGREGFRMKKGQKFVGSAAAAEKLKKMGLIEEAAQRRAKKEEA